MGPTWGPPGSCRPQVGPCWPIKPCYQSSYSLAHHSESGFDHGGLFYGGEDRAVLGIIYICANSNLVDTFLQMPKHLQKLYNISIMLFRMKYLINPKIVFDKCHRRNCLPCAHPIIVTLAGRLIFRLSLHQMP